MADQFSKNRDKQDERLKGPEAPEKRAEKPSGKEIRETAKEFVEGVSEVVEGAEAAEFAEGEVAEEVKEGKKKAPAGAMRGGAGVAEPSVSAAVPSVDVMRIQVATQIHAEIRLLEKEVTKIMSNRVRFEPSRLNGLVAKIRELKDILANLAYAAADTLKGWWMKFVKGITI